MQINKAAPLRDTEQESDKPLKMRKMRKNFTSQNLDMTFTSTGEWSNKEVKTTEDEENQMIDKEKQIELMKAGAEKSTGL